MELLSSWDLPDDLGINFWIKNAKKTLKQLKTAKWLRISQFPNLVSYPN